MDPTTITEILKFGTTGLVVFIMFKAFSEFKSTLSGLSNNWQVFITDLKETDTENHKMLLAKLEALEKEFVKLREDFNRAVTMMEERTRKTRSNRNP